MGGTATAKQCTHRVGSEWTRPVSLPLCSQMWTRSISDKTTGALLQERGADQQVRKSARETGKKTLLSHSSGGIGAAQSSTPTLTWAVQ